VSRRVLIVTPDFPPEQGGIQLLAHRLAINLQSMEAGVVTFGGDGAEQFDAGGEIDVRRVGRRTKRWHRLRVAALNLAAYRQGRRKNPDVVISGHVVTFPAAHLLSRRTGAATILYLHADEFRHRRRLLRWAMERADAVVAVSAHTRSMAAAAGCESGKLHVVMPGVDRPPPLPREPAAAPTLITVARLSDRYKGHDVVTRAMPLVRARVPDARWIVVGDGPLRAELENLARECGVAGAITFTGSLPDAERDAWLSRSHVFTMPSRLPAGGSGGEGFGIVYLEAAALGLPVVAGAVGGALDAVVEGQTGLLVDPEDPEAVAAALSALLLDPARAAALGAAGAARAAEMTWRRHAEAVERIAAGIAWTRA
jgi:phosphatidylinositol alpha-1,6-mannosyltransferase